MQNHQENPETLEDIIFRNRNKSYGAYSLRTDYQRVISRSLLIGIGLFCLAILTPMIWAKVEWKENKEVTAQLINVVIPPPPVEVTPPIQPETPPPPQPEQQVRAETRFVEPVIVEDDKATELPPDQDDLNKASNIGTKDVVGIDEPIPVDDPDIGKGTEPAQPVEVKVDEKDKEWMIVEQMPEYAGGVAALSKFLQKNLRYPNPASNAGVSGKVYVQFVVGQDGAISKVDILKGLGFGCDEEAERVIKLMPHWSAGKQSGRAVAVKFTLPISFQLTE
jgi:periplasmic protein TonB